MIDQTSFPSADSVRTLRAGIFGASGYTGREVCRLLTHHPHVEIVFATSRSHAGKRLDALDPASPPILLCAPDDAALAGADVAFVCLPHGSSARTSQRCLQANLRVVDLSGDFRLRTPELHAAVYGSARDEHVAASSVYGLTEHARAALPAAGLVANPGCYPTCTALALAPLAAADLLGEGPVIVNALSGVSGAGATPTDTTHFCSVHGDVRPYKVGRVHRHVPEMEQTLAAFGASSPTVVFTPHLIPLVNGLLVTATVSGINLEPSEVRRLYAERYEDEPFVRLLPEGESARIRAAAGTNDAVVALHPAPDVNTLVVTCAIDNLLKGAAGQAVQNLNAMYGWPEPLGLPSQHAMVKAGAVLAGNNA